MPRTKVKTSEVKKKGTAKTTKEVPSTLEEKIIDPDLLLEDDVIVADVLEEDGEEAEEDDSVLAEDEIDPFKDRWEE